jgi:serine O-acetyltransferase
MRLGELLYLIRSDLYRYRARADWGELICLLVWGEPGFRYTFWMRTVRYLRERRWLLLPLYVLARLLLCHYEYKFGISISTGAEIGPGFYVGHFGGIVVSPRARIGRNCNISQSVTIGQANRGKRQGVPTIGDNVYIGAGAVIIGNIRIGNDVAVGANCVVLDDVPDNGVVVGVPGRVVSSQGSKGYVNRTDYDGKI